MKDLKAARQWAIKCESSDKRGCFQMLYSIVTRSNALLYRKGYVSVAILLYKPILCELFID